MRASCFDTLLCRVLICWPQRVRQGRVRLPATWDPGEAEPYFHGAVCEELPGHSDTDIALGLKRYVEAQPCVASWYEHVLALEGIEVDWLESEPRLPSSAAARWQYLCNFLDADTLLAFDFARKYGSSGRIEERIGKWRTTVRCTDYDLDTLLRRGVSDLHVHLGGVRIPQAVWLELMDNPRAAVRYPRLDSAYRASGGGAGASLSDAVRTARLYRGMLARQLSVPVEQKLSPLRDRWWCWDASALLQERVLLINAWQRARWDDSTLEALDRYAFEKHRFAELSRQQAFAGETGLRRFSREYFPRMARKSGTEVHRSSHRFSMQATGDACAFLLESRCLERVELRLQPMLRAADYWKYFSLWKRLEKQINNWTESCGRAKPVTVRFAIHFKRSRDRTGKSDRMLPLVRKLHDVERQSAALRAALACPSRGHLLDPLARIDVAGDERDMGCAHFGPYLRLLRGDADAARGLEKLFDDSDAWPEQAAAFSRWARLRERGLHRFSPSDRRLGLTVHAGEDFADRLDGLYQIASAVNACGLHSGDAVGHGLALAYESHQGRRPGMPNAEFIRAGPAFDSLCWLLSCLELEPVEQTRSTREALERAIVASAGELFPEFRRDIRYTDAIGLWRACSNPLTTSKDQLSELSKHMWRASVVGDDVELRREKIVPVHDRARFGEAVDIAGRSLLKILIEKRIVIEMNPSSNLRISGAVEPGDSPTVGIFEAVNKGLLACINTDNPGVFVTCIENEFAILMESARGRMPEGEIRQLLEQVRRVGMEQVNWH